MLRDYTQQIIGTASLFKPRSNAVDWKSIGDSLKSMDTSFKTKDLASALESGDAEAINKAKAALDPAGYAKYLDDQAIRAEDRAWALEDQATKQRNALDLLAQQQQNALALENLRNQNARGLAEYKAGLSGGVAGANSVNAADVNSIDTAQKGIDQLAEVGKAGNIGVFTDWRRRHGLTGWFDNDVEADMGKISSAVAAVAPRAIANLKKSGVSGINTKGEFMQYIGLPENPTSEQILGALPLISEIAGTKNPLEAKTKEDPLGLR